MLKTIASAVADSAATLGDKVEDELRTLLDEPKNTRLTLGGGGYLRRLVLAPVKDVEALGKKQKLGRVLAYDPEKRTLLIEKGSAPAPRAEWKDAAFLERQVTARKVRWGMEGIAQQLSKEYPPEQVVFVHVLRGDHANIARPGSHRRFPNYSSGTVGRSAKRYLVKLAAHSVPADGW